MVGYRNYRQEEDRIRFERISIPLLSGGAPGDACNAEVTRSGPSTVFARHTILLCSAPGRSLQVRAIQILRPEPVAQHISFVQAPEAAFDVFDRGLYFGGVDAGGYGVLRHPGGVNFFYLSLKSFQEI